MTLFSRYMILYAMEQHPVPRDVTSFEFHLVGDMTLKQFMYLAVGLGLAYLFFATLLSKQPLIAVPLIVICGLSGAAFAFLPISDRPLDHWLIAFFKAIYSPTKAVLQIPGQPGVVGNRLQAYLTGLGVSTPPPLKPMSPLPAPKLSRITPTPPPAGPVSSGAGGPILQPTITQPATSQLGEMAHNAQILQDQLAETAKRINELKEAIDMAHTPTPNLSQVLQPISGTLKNLANQTENLLQQTTATSRVLATPPKKPQVMVVQAQTQPRAQMILTSQPNVINGVVEDQTGNILEGVIVSIHDKDNLPVRALKTNKLGQFAGATPLPSGIYTISLEKDGFIFDNLQITLQGEIIAPMKIVAKKES